LCDTVNIYIYPRGARSSECAVTHTHTHTHTLTPDRYRKLEAIAKIETATLRKLSEEGHKGGIDDQKYSDNASEYEEALER